MSDYELHVFIQLNPEAPEFVPSEPSPLPPPGFSENYFEKHCVQLNQWLLDLIDESLTTEPKQKLKSD